MNKKVTRKVQLMERVNGRISKNEQYEIDEFIEKVFSELDSRTINQAIEDVYAKATLFDKMFRRQELKLKKLRVIKAATHSVIKLNIDVLITKDKVGRKK